MKVIGTAGHIDHGKSALVRRLTGIDPDRLAEEKQRGMTIDLGFAWLTLPSGQEVSVVDVPGHERFVKNMLAGAGGIDVALLVVAADEAVMPQTREHVDILDLLGIEHGVVALSKADLADEEWRELAAAEVADLLSPTSLAGSQIVPVSAVTGEGIPELLCALDAALVSAPPPADRGVPYLPVDRVFTVPGFGTVLTGTLRGGPIAVGEELEVMPAGRRGRVRSLQTHRRQVERAGPGARLAVNLAGVRRDEARRGDVLAHPGTTLGTRVLDVRLRVLPTAPFALHHGMDVTMHLGAAERGASLRLLGADSLGPGERGWARLRLREPVVAVRGQRLILRLPAPARTVAGGEVADIAPRHRRRDAAGLPRLEALTSLHADQVILAALPHDRPRRAAQIAMTVGMTEDDVGQELQRLERQGTAVRLGTSYLSEAGWTATVRRVEQTLLRYHATNPLRRGMPKEEVRSKLGWSQGVWAAALTRLSQSGIVQDLDSSIAALGHRGGTASRRAEADRILAILQRDPFSPPSGNELLAAARADPGLLAAMTQEGEIVRVAEGLYLAADAYHTMVERTIDLIRNQGEVTVAGIRDSFGTSRKYALAFLEHLDGQHVTRRQGDVRVLGSKAPACA